MTTPPDEPARVRDLNAVEGQAELVGGRVVRLPLHGHWQAVIIGQILRSLHDHARRSGRGEVFSSTLGYVVPPLPSGRESFCPDASYHDGPPPADPMDFVAGPPTLAIEVRDDEPDEAARSAKRTDYVAAGTLVVWDVDPEAETVRVYRADSPDAPAAQRLRFEASAPSDGLPNQKCRAKMP